MDFVSIQAEPFDVAAQTRLLLGDRVDIGALVSFVGLCRAEAGMLAALELEHYPGMAEDEIRRALAQARARWRLCGARVIHRHGALRPGEPIVLVLTASQHRAEAFAAAEFLMDYLKTRAPFWKKEHRADGSAGDWVSAKDEDDRAAARWS